ncbi:MAG: right-handed parallel beta-helix repeat-containing protein, partial [Candidatus Eremiobacteraeota bacterium]|nr:right-handed parallel beta-helix repeat-containing protein [Candidatus Eremiobacteraeota bacterium]
TFYNNCSFDLGGGIYIDEKSDPSITNCIFMNNKGDTQGGGIYCSKTSSLTITYSDLYNNMPFAGYNDAAGSGGDHTNFNGWGWNGIGCSGDDPTFVNAETGDLHLQDDSPCIDTGDPAYAGYLLNGSWETQSGSPDTSPVDLGYHYYIYYAP